jgi:TolB-like protein
MNDMETDSNGAAPFQANDVRAACDSILASDLFRQSPRISRLLRFLVEKAISGTIQDTTEYAIGIAVFNRDPSKYYTSEDPIVRVQVGRLRAKLKAYYAMPGTGDDCRICIPVGSYMPSIQRTNAASGSFKPPSRFAVYPFKCLSHQSSGKSFAHGLHDELVHQLYKTFGEIVVAGTDFAPKNAVREPHASYDALHQPIKHRLEGSIQIAAGVVKASIRLIDASTCHITLSEQFNRNGSLTIALQEDLASSICASLKRFFP